jgi:HEAT repeat protein
MSNLRPWHIPVLVLLWSAGSARGEIRPDFEMDREPEIHVPATVKVFSKRQKPLWLKALARPDAEMQRLAADAIGRAHTVGFPELDEAVSGLVAVLTAPESHPAARLSAAQALIALDAKETAPQMGASAEKFGTELRQIVEPALAAWNYDPHRSIWQARLTMAGTRRRELVLAIRCLAMVKDHSGVARLLDMVHDRFRPADVRLEAAQAAGLLQDSGLDSDARRLLAAGQASPLVDRLCAVKLVARHSESDSQKLLADLAVDGEPAVAVVALQRLIEIDPRLVLPLAERAMQSTDAKVRQRGADAYVLLPDPQRVGVLARLLDDPHPAVRGSVRESLFELSRRPELDEPVRQGATAMLAGDRWRGLEQAALLLGALDHKSAAARLVELLEFARPEVGIAAAWGLKKFAIPETLPAMFDKARRNTEIRKSGPALTGLDEQTANLFESFGRMMYAPADPLFREYIPKDYAMGILSRSTAIWSLGLLHAGVADEPLAEKLMERIADDTSGPGNPPEMRPVKVMGAVSIVRMKAVSQVTALRKRVTPPISPDRVGMAMRWAVMQLTGESIPEPPPPTEGKSNWFLESLDD